jgi:hypothetical protein
VDALELEPGVSLDGRGVVFMLSVRGRDIECIVTREALEQHFWVHLEQLMRTFSRRSQKAAGAS